MKALIYVRGGSVQAVICDSEDFKYKIIDFDNFETDEEAERSEKDFDFYEPDEIREIED